jgi:hypothetical protein
MSATHADDREHHSHPAPERLGKVSFPISCAPSVTAAFGRAMALLHSFAYTPAEQAFADVAARDPACAIAHWGLAMSRFHQLWEPPAGEDLKSGTAESAKAVALQAHSARERQFIDALSAYYRDTDQDPHPVRAKRYSAAMADVARNNPNDPEAQIFYALSLIATAAQNDKSHAQQKQAADILEPLYRRFPQHPGLAHYLIHAYDSAELAPRGVAAARAYSKIAPSAPHALHMPSHVFTRLGLWRDSIKSNLAARAAAQAQGDIGEELHAMDYLTYAYLQLGDFDRAGKVVADLKSMPHLAGSDFKIGYAATAMPVRRIVERQAWGEATALEPLPDSKPHIAAIVYWARALGQARSGHPQEADAEIRQLQDCVTRARASSTPYWATQTDVLLREAQAWQFAANGKAAAALDHLSAAADEEDALEKLPVTPGPIVPAREQLASLLLQLERPQQAAKEYQAALRLAPGRRGSLLGAQEAAKQTGTKP